MIRRKAGRLGRSAGESLFPKISTELAERVEEVKTIYSKGDCTHRSNDFRCHAHPRSLYCDMVQNAYPRICELARRYPAVQAKGRRE